MNTESKNRPLTIRLHEYLCVVCVVSWGIAAAAAHAQGNKTRPAADSGLAGHWTLEGDCDDHSGNGNHGRNHGVDLRTGQFNGRDSYIEVPNSPSLNFGTRDFSLCAWVHTEKDVDDVVGDVLSKYAPTGRKGFNISIKSTAGGYNSQGDDKHVYFGIDDDKVSDWEDCGRPEETSNYVNNSLTVYDGHLYAGITDAATEEKWCHVFRYEGGGKWADCGRVGNLKTTGAFAMTVHKGKLYVATGTYDWTRVLTGEYDPGRVYCYEGGTTWRDCGQPSTNRRLTCMASFRGKLYVGGGNEPGCFCL